MKRALYVLHKVIDGLLPSACALCGMLSPAVICKGCAVCLSDTHSRCVVCALPLVAGEYAQDERGAPVPARPHGALPHDAQSHDARADILSGQHGAPICGRCIAREPAFDATVCVADYVEPADSLAIALKFHKHLALANVFGTALATRANAAATPLPELIVPVPLSAARLARRGYNQAWQIARTFAKAIGRPATARCLVRTRDTRAQSGLRGAERWRNMRRAFVVAQPASVHGAHIGLVDDVMTSGATLHAASQALKRAGAARVTVFVVLRTPTF